MLFINCLIFSILTLFNYMIAGKRLTYPPFLFCALWLFLFVFRIIFTQFYLQDFYPISINTYWLFIAGGVVTTIAGYIVMLQNSVTLKANQAIQTNSPRQFFITGNETFNIRLVLTVLSVVIFPLFIKYIAAIVIASQVENIFKSIRYETAVEGQGFGIYAYVITYAAFLSLLNGYCFWRDQSKRNKRLYIGSLVMAILYGVCTMGRTPVLSAIVFNIALYLISNKKVKLFRLLRYALLFCALFIGMGVLMEKGGDLNSSFTENVNSGVENLGLYILSPMNAIDVVLNGHEPLKYGIRTFRFFYVLFNSLGFIKVDVADFDIVDEFIFVPYDVNVYTYYNPYVRDFGALFSLFCLFIFMSWHSWAFVKCINNPNSYFPKLTYCFLCYPLLMSIFNDQYATLFSTWLQLYVCAGLFYALVFIFQKTKSPRLLVPAI